MSELYTEEWHIAPWGTTLDDGCGDMENLCADLQETLFFGVEDHGATVFIQVDESDIVPIEICIHNEMPIQTGVTIIGLYGRPILTCSDVLYKYSILNLNFVDDEVNNIEFMGSSIIVSDSKLIINDCIFNQTALFLSWPDKLSEDFYFNEKTSLGDIKMGFPRKSDEICIPCCARVCKYL